MDPERFDVVIAGAGLVGLALAPALARAGLSVALVDRAPIVAPDPDPATWDARVYAISPGSAAFLRAIGAWQRLPPERVTPVEAMRVDGRRRRASCRSPPTTRASARSRGSSRSGRCAPRCSPASSRPASR